MFAAIKIFVSFINTNINSKIYNNNIISFNKISMALMF